MHIVLPPGPAPKASGYASDSPVRGARRPDATEPDVVKQEDGLTRCELEEFEQRNEKSNTRHTRTFSVFCCSWFQWML